jgi:[acyl-carrier-protein] S-malonyltransferase
VFAVLCPGQGSQTPGLLSPWLTDPAAHHRLTEWSAAAGLNLIELGTRADSATIRDTAVAQPLIVATSLLSFQTAADAGHRLPPSFVTAGHSVGEFAAATIAGVLSPSEAIRLVAIRGRAMAECAANAPTGMVAVIGGDPEAVEGAVQAAGLVVANVNGAGQVVAAGLESDIARLRPPPSARLRRLDVAGAFHTSYMATARDRLARAVASLPPRPASAALPVLSCLDGLAITDPATLLDRLVQQVVAPVRWDLVMRTMSLLPLTLAAELAPAGVLTGLVRRELPDLPRVKLTDPASAVDAARQVSA